MGMCIGFNYLRILSSIGFFFCRDNQVSKFTQKNEFLGNVFNYRLLQDGGLPLTEECDLFLFSVTTSPLSVPHIRMLSPLLMSVKTP